MQVMHGFQETCGGVSVFSLWQNNWWDNNKYSTGVVLTGLDVYNTRL